jgi:hypothetical protein
VSARSHPFSLGRGEIARLREALLTASFNADRILETLGVKSMRELTELSAENAIERTAGDDPLHVFLRLFVAGLPCRSEAARAAFEPLSLERCADGGLLSLRNDEVIADVGMTATDGLILAFDRLWPGQFEEPEDYVMGPSDSARYLSRFMIPEPCDRSLDLGTGCGLLALLEAGRSGHVVASDINPRATAFTVFNAHLNALDNVETVVGSLFEPLKGMVFDRIISNPPFVISPEHRLIYLTGGMRSDGLCRRLATEAPAKLADEGWFQMLCNWVEPEEGEWFDGIGQWFTGSGCDTWVMRHSTRDTETYARSWMRMGSRGKAARDPERLETWLQYFRQEGIHSIGQGLVTMRKRRGSNWFRAFDGPPTLRGSVGGIVVERIKAIGFLARCENESTLMDSVLTASSNAHLTVECVPVSGAWSQIRAELRMAQGLAYVEEVDAYVAELVAACDGKRRLREAIDCAAGRLGWSTADVPDATPGLVRQLIEEGFLVPVVPESEPPSPS